MVPLKDRPVALGRVFETRPYHVAEGLAGLQLRDPRAMTLSNTQIIKLIRQILHFHTGMALGSKESEPIRSRSWSW